METQGEENFIYRQAYKGEGYRAGEAETGVIVASRGSSGIGGNHKDSGEEGALLS